MSPSPDIEEVVQDDPRDQDYVMTSPGALAGDSGEEPPAAKRRRRSGVSNASRPPGHASAATRGRTRGRLHKNDLPAKSSGQKASQPQDVSSEEDEHTADSPNKRRRTSARHFVPQPRDEDNEPTPPSLFVFDDVDGHDTATLVRALKDHLAARRF